MCFLHVKGLPRLWSTLNMRVPHLNRLHLDILRGIKDTSIPLVISRFFPHYSGWGGGNLHIWES